MTTLLNLKSKRNQIILMTLLLCVLIIFMWFVSVKKYSFDVGFAVVCFKVILCFTKNYFRFETMSIHFIKVEWLEHNW